MVGSTIGLYYNGARYLAAWLGRWTSADPIGIGADGPGLYNYTRGSPVNYTDPTGTDRRENAFDMGGRNATENARLRDDAATEVVKGAWNSAVEDFATFSRGSLRSDPGEKGSYLREQEQIKNKAVDKATEGAKFEGVSPTAELAGSVLTALPGLIVGGAEVASLGRLGLSKLLGGADEAAEVLEDVATAARHAEPNGGPYRVPGAAPSQPSVPPGARAGNPEVVVDTNGLIDRFDRGGDFAKRFETALDGRRPVIPQTAAKEYMRGTRAEQALTGSARVAARRARAETLREFLSANDGRIGRAAVEQEAQLREIDVGFHNMTRRGSNKLPRVGISDQRVIGSAARESLPLLTRDDKLTRIMNFFGIKPGPQGY